MAPPLQDQVPDTIRAGETVKFRRWFNDYPPADGWIYTIYFNGATAVFNSQAVTDPDDASAYLVTLTPAATEILPGIYRYIERVALASTGEVYTPDEGVVLVEPDLATAPAGATLSFAEKTLSVIEGALSGRLTSDMQSYQIGGRAIVKIPAKELMQMRGYFASMVWRQANPGKIGAPIYTEFLDETNDANYPSTWVDVTGLPGAGQ